MGVGRHRDGHAGLVDLLEPPVARPSASVARRVSIHGRLGRASLCGGDGGCGGCGGCDGEGEQENQPVRTDGASSSRRPLGLVVAAGVRVARPRRGRGLLSSLWDETRVSLIRFAWSHAVYAASFWPSRVLLCFQSVPLLRWGSSAGAVDRSEARCPSLPSLLPVTWRRRPTCRKSLIFATRSLDLSPPTTSSSLCWRARSKVGSGTDSRPDRPK